MYVKTKIVEVYSTRFRRSASHIDHDRSKLSAFMFWGNCLRCDDGVLLSNLLSQTTLWEAAQTQTSSSSHNYKPVRKSREGKHSNYETVQTISLLNKKKNVYFANI